MSLCIKRIDRISFAALARTSPSAEIVFGLGVHLELKERVRQRAPVAQLERPRARLERLERVGIVHISSIGADSSSNGYRQLDDYFAVSARRELRVRNYSRKKFRILV